MTDLPELAISVHAPWAWALMHGGKDVENRATTFPRRVGRVWVHASAWPGTTKVGLWNDMTCSMVSRWLEECGQVGRRRALHLRDKDAMFALRGHIVGSVEVYGYRMPDDPPDSPWYVPGSLAILVRNPRPLAQPVAEKGLLGWWRPQDDVLEQLRRAA